MLIKIVILFIFVIAFKASSNYIKFKRCQKLSKMHMDWLADSCDEFSQYKGEVKKLFLGANIPDSCIPTSQAIGYGQIANANASVYLNFPSKVMGIAAALTDKFDEAIGTYRTRFLESFSPLYWIETILFLPKNLLQYIGLDSEKIAFKLCNILLTFIWWCLGVAFMFFKPQLQEFLISLIN